MNWLLEPLDIYCERSVATLFAEPLNLFSNLCFILVGVILLLRMPKNNTLKALCYMFITVGIGSALFHSFANRITQIADVLPIGICIVFFCGSLINNINLTKVGKISTGAGFIVLEMFLMKIKIPHLNGSELYLGPLLFIVFFALVLRNRNRACSNFLLLAAICFILAIVFRVLDMKLCSSFPHGTHFMWHNLNSLTLMFAYIALGSLLPDET